MNFPDVMVDLETGSTNPEYGPILQIAAVRFNLEERTIDVENMFDECLRIPPYRFWSDGTREFWAKQPHHILQGIMQRMRDPADVLREFQAWSSEGGIRRRFWAKPTSFEWPFVASYFEDHELAMPYAFWEAMDLRSFVRGLYFPEAPLNDKSIPFEGDQHNAIFDVLHQIKFLFTAADQAKGAGEVLPPAGTVYGTVDGQPVFER